MAPDPSGVVVGYDGSPTSDIALQWAVQAAQAHGMPLTLLRARPDAEGEIAEVTAPGSTEAVGDAVPSDMAEAVARVRAEQSDLPVRTVVHPGSPVAAMLAASQQAQMLVIGSRGLEGFRGLLLGSTTMQVVPYASCPVVVLYQPDEATAAARASARHPEDVVVGYDGSASADLALRFGLRHAKACNYGVAVVIVRRGTGDAGPAQPIDLDSPDTDADTRALAEQARGIAADEPTVAVSYLVGVGRPAAVLIAEASGAPLAALGARGRGGFAGLVLGSVGMKMLMHAECPVAVVHGRGPEA